VPEFEDYIAKKVAPFVPGVAVVIVSGGQIKSLNGYGVRRAGTRETITPDTVFRLASLSKAVAATSASVLVNEGKISWDTTVTSVLPNITFSNARYGKQLTLRHALSQSSGLPRHTYSHFIDANKSYADSVARLRYVNFVCPPGKCFAYQNVMYSLSGDMIKNKAGMSFEQYTEEKIFDPLGMRSASYGLASYNASPNRAAPHVNNGKRWIPTAVTGNWYRVAPAAGVNASIVDMSRFLLAQMGKRQDVLPLSVLNPIQSRVTKNTPAQNYYGVRKAVGNTAYGMGWRVFDYGRNKNFIHHGGHVKGFRTEMVFNRDLQIGMVFLSNSETRLARDVIFKFLDSYERAQTAARAAAKKKK
jgi:beta-lactamase class C